MMTETLGALLKEGTDFLEKAGIEEARLDAWLLLEYATGKNRAYFFAHQDEVAETESTKAYRALLEKRATHIPLQHLTHQGFFMGYEFYVNEHVLIPRQDTETLAEAALEVLKNRENPEILDMCTGSGCILISLLLEKEDASGVGADLSTEALKVAKKNAETLKVQQQALFLESNLFSNAYFYKKDGKSTRKYDILISNPPYIATAEIETLMEEVKFHDPRMALDGFEDGLYFYREITERAQEFLKPGGYLMYEIGCGQGKDVAELLEKAGFEKIEIRQDLCGLDRVVLGQKPMDNTQEEPYV